MIDFFFDELDEKNKNISEISNEEANEIVKYIVEDKINLEEYHIYKDMPRYQYVLGRLVKVMQISLKYIKNGIDKSDFEVLNHELNFKSEEKFKLKLKNGIKIKLVGKIDRVDICKTEEGEFIRIVDYKSSKKDINLNDVVSGLQLQILTYLNAVCEDKYLPAGALYFKFDDPVISEDDSTKLEAKLESSFKMSGVMTCDDYVIRKMDTELVSNYSKIIPIRVNKDGINYKFSKIINKENIEKLNKAINDIIVQTCENITSGNIEIKPYYKKNGGKRPCEYCDYKSICNFESGINKMKFKYIENKTQNEILENL